MKTTFAVLVAGVLAAASVAGEQDEKIQGAWVSPPLLDRSGQPRKLQVDDRLTLGETFSMRLGGKDSEGTYTTDATKTPNQIDLVTSKGKTLRGIYALQYGQLWVCLGEERPTEFISEKMDGLMILEPKK